MTGRTHRAVRDYIHEVSGIALSERKAYLLEHRLRPLLEEVRAGSLDGLVEHAQGDASGDLRRRILDAITTQETSFFRDPKTFEWIARSWWPRARTRKRIDAWCAACSTGQEPYSLAMLFAELGGPPARIIATDLARPALDHTQAGLYTDAELSRGLSSDRRRRFFSKEGERWRLATELRSQVEPRRLNLQRPWTGLGRLDLILLRNVLIYFDPPTRSRVAERAAERLRPGGVLLFGATEPAPETASLARREEGGVVFFERADRAVG